MGLSGRGSLLQAACLLALTACSGGAEGQMRTTPDAAVATELTELPGVDLSPLAPEQRQKALELFRESLCDCGCGMTIAVCRVDDPSCERSPALAAEVIRRMAEGQSVEQAAAEVLDDAAPNELVFDVAVGKAFFDGPEDAAVTLIAFLDYQCPFCRGLDPTLAALRREFPRDLRVVYKQHPLRNHYWAKVAAEAVLAAGAQGKQLEMGRLLFARQEEMFDRLNKKALEMRRRTHDADVQREVFVEFAAELGLDAGRVRRELENRTYLKQVEAESTEAERVGARGTPASFVNGRYIPGAKPVDLFRREVQKEIRWARSGTRPDFPAGSNIAELSKPKGEAETESEPAPARRRSVARDETEKVLVFDVPVGDSVAIGPPAAVVTLISFLDYQ